MKKKEKKRVLASVNEDLLKEARGGEEPTQGDEDNSTTGAGTPPPHG